MVDYLVMIDKEELKKAIKRAQFISLLVYEVKIINNTSWVCMHLYTSKNNRKQSYLIAIHKMEENCNFENLYKLVISNLKGISNMDDNAIAT